MMLSRQQRWLLFVMVLIAAVPVACVLFEGYRLHQIRKQIGTPESRERFRVLAESKFEGVSAEEIEEAFCFCFKEGDDASKYADILSIAPDKSKLDDAGTSYCWWISNPRQLEGAEVLCVQVGGEPPRIESVMIIPAVD